MGVSGPLRMCPKAFLLRPFTLPGRYKQNKMYPMSVHRKLPDKLIIRNRCQCSQREAQPLKLPESGPEILELKVWMDKRGQFLALLLCWVYHQSSSSSMSHSQQLWWQLLLSPFFAAEKSKFRKVT